MMKYDVKKVTEAMNEENKRALKIQAAEQVLDDDDDDDCLDATFEESEYWDD